MEFCLKSCLFQKLGLQAGTSMFQSLDHVFEDVLVLVVPVFTLLCRPGM